jgi:FkbM family methyltransferase
MMMDWDTLVQRYGLKRHVTGVLHCGAHLAEEAPDYDQAFGPEVPVWWVEANIDVLGKIEAELKPYPNQRIIPALLAETGGALRDFHVTNYDGMSSSMLEFGTHPRFSPDTVFVDHRKMITNTIDGVTAVFGIRANMLVMDLQGAEGLVLAGAKHFLTHCDFVMSEINRDEVYVGCAKIGELDSALRCFSRVETLWTPNGWGDAFWVRTHNEAGSMV